MREGGRPADIAHPRAEGAKGRREGGRGPKSSSRRIREGSTQEGHRLRKRERERTRGRSEEYKEKQRDRQASREGQKENERQRQSEKKRERERRKERAGRDGETQESEQSLEKRRPSNRRTSMPKKRVLNGEAESAVWMGSLSWSAELTGEPLPETHPNSDDRPDW